jgi:hypothetical protein
MSVFVFVFVFEFEYLNAVVKWIHLNSFCRFFLYLISSVFGNIRRYLYSII